MRASPAGGVEHGFGGCERFTVGAHVVHPEEARAPFVSEHRCGHRAGDPISRLLYTRDLLNEAFARGPDQDRETQIYDGVQVAQERQVVLEVLPVADAGIHDYVLGPDARRDSVLGPLSQEVSDLANHVLVVGVLLHGLRLALHVHEDHRALSFLYYRDHAGVAAESGNVVEEACAGFEGCRRHAGPVGVDRDHRLGTHGEYSLDHRDDAPNLLLLRDWVRTGAG